MPVRIVYTERGVGAAGLGWDVPLSYVRRDTTFARRRPVGTAGVAPQGREQLSVVLDGRRIDLVQTATAWVARRDAPDIELRAQADGSWVMFDGQGRTYLFSSPSPALIGTNLWLLTDVSSAVGSKLHLDYGISALSLAGGPAISIDLTSVSYNSSPTTTGCYKNTVDLAYDSSGSAPLSIAVLNGVVTARMHKLTSVDVSGVSACGVTPELIRSYQLAYQADVDTGEPRLVTVHVVGRAGTLENQTPMPIASYQYGSASSAGKLVFQPAGSLPSGFANLGNTSKSTVSGVGQGYATALMFTDVTGDGRPDRITFADGTLSVARNISSTTAIAFDPAQPIDLAMTPRAPEAHTLTASRYGVVENTDMTWRQPIDVNGDGRLDIVDAAEQNAHWVVYLNTPDPDDPTHIRWLRRSVSTAKLTQQLSSRGMTVDPAHVPLAQRQTFRDSVIVKCWMYFPDTGWAPSKDQNNCPGGWSGELFERTYTEWEVRDINGDGYPDVVLNSSPVVHTSVSTPFPDSPSDFQKFNQATLNSQGLADGSDNRIDAIFNVLGTRLTDGDVQPFSAPVTLIAHDACGVDKWSSGSTTTYQTTNRRCGFEDVNGDGILDRVTDTSVYLGTGSSTAPFTPGAMLTLPGPLAIHQNSQVLSCAAPATSTTTFTASTAAMLRDVTGDGVPDYVSVDAGNHWTVFVGTGTSFSNALAVNGPFGLSTETEDCGGTSSNTTSGLFDFDGDGKPDIVSGGKVWMLSRFGSTLGVPDAGRLVRIGNGYGANTNIRYRSEKGDAGSLHQVPFPEIVVDSVAASSDGGTFGDLLLPTSYAYGGAELIYDPANDAFAFHGYRRMVELSTPVSQPAGVATITVTDHHAPISATDPYGVIGGSVLDPTQRYNLYLRIGRVSDVTVLTGNFGAAALATPSLLLAINVDNDPRRTAAVHHDWNSRTLAASSDPPGPEPCSEMVAPYDYAASTAYASNNATFDACKMRGFGYGASEQSWRGEPGSAPPATGNVQVRSDVLSVDGFGRVLSIKLLNDVNRDDDDICIDTAYPDPTGSDSRVLFAPSSRTVTACNTTIYAKEAWEYDGLSVGSVSAGLVTAHLVERRDDAGAWLGTIRQFDATYDNVGNLDTIATTREDGATRTVKSTYDPFGLVPITVTVASPTAPTLQTSIERDAVTLSATTITDPQGTQHGAEFDGFSRAIRSTVKPPGGATGTLSRSDYLGFAGGGQRRIVRKVFTDAVSPEAEFAAPARTSTVFLDSLGRSLRTEFPLGADYQNKTLVVGARTYDGLGRLLYEADPYATASSDFPVPRYGTTYHFNADGSPSCMVRGTGQQPFTDVTAEGSEIFPTCFSRTFEDHTEVIGVRDASALLAGSPQAGVTRKSYVTAIGRTLTRSTLQSNTRLEHAMLGYDRLGHRISMTRYLDAPNAAKPVTSSWRYDSLGQLLELDEPGNAPQSRTYSDWGELTSVTRTVSSPATTLSVRSSYDAYSRLIHQEQGSDTSTDADTVVNYQYDVAVDLSPQVTATHVLGRLAQASSPTGVVAFSYDTLGQINARVFTDTQGGAYVEKHTMHSDGSLAALDLYLPDTAYADEHVDYTYDSAGKGRSVKYTNGSETTDLYTASEIDLLGRVRQAQYGSTRYSATYADVGRNLLVDVAIAGFGSASRQIFFGTFDPLGRERDRIEMKNDGESFTVVSSTYDSLGRLSHALRTTDDTIPFDQRFTYDSLGNILSIADSPSNAAASTTTLAYDEVDRDRVCHIAYGTGSTTGCNVTYDEVGSITTQKTATGVRDYSYYIDGSIRTITNDKGSEAHFRYDAFGEVQELDLTSSTSLDTRHDRRYGGLIAWRDVTAGMSLTSVLSRTIPGPDGFAATRRGAGGPWLFTFGEARGSRFATDQNGTFVQDVEYQPFGTPSSAGAQPGSLLYSNEQWNGRDALAAFGISHLGARLYDPAIGRFLSRDPLLIPRTATTSNPYAFADNDPVNASDPSGLVRETIEAQCFFCGDADGGDSSNDGPFHHDKYGLDTSFANSDGIVWVVGKRDDSGDGGDSGGSHGSKGNKGNNQYIGGGPPFAQYQATPQSIVPAQVEEILDLSPENQVVKALEAATDAVEAAAPVLRAAGEAAIETGLDMTPIIGSIRICGRGDIFGCISSVTSDVLVVGKLARLGGLALRGLRGGAKAGPALARELGVAGEAAAGIVKNTTRIPSLTGTASYRIPDVLNREARLLGEVKNVGSLSYTNQLRDFVGYAKQQGFRFELTVRQGTQLSGPLQRAVNAGDIILRRTLP